MMSYTVAMPRYFFDVTNDGEASRDRKGGEFPSLEAARQEALHSLGEIAKLKFGDGDRRDLSIEIRDGEQSFLRVSLSLRVEKLA